MTDSGKPSDESDALRALYASWTERMAADPDMDLTTLRDVFEEWHLPTVEPTEVSYREVDVDGISGLWVLPAGAATDRAFLFAHGGGFVTGSRATHRKLAGHLAKAVGCIGLVIDYRRAPEDPFPAQLEDGVRAYRWLLDQGFESGHLFTTGDSAGGNLAVSIPLKLRELGVALPAAIHPMSPWLDMKHEGSTLVTNAATDALVTPAILTAMSGMFLGGSGDPSDPLANPLGADLSGLPPMFVNAGGAEALLNDAERLVERARAAGVDVTLEVGPGMQHVYTFLAGRAPEGDAAIASAAAWVRPHLGLA